MTINCVNPWHPVSLAMNDENMGISIKMIAILAFLNGGKVEITSDNINDFLATDKQFCVFHFYENSIEAKLVSAEEGAKIASDAGGLPS